MNNLAVESKLTSKQIKNHGFQNHKITQDLEASEPKHFRVIDPEGFWVGAVIKKKGTGYQIIYQA